MRILVTGATGFVGQAICKVLAEKNYDIIKVGGRNSRRLSEREADYTIDVTDSTEVEKLSALEDVSIIIHCAGLAHQPDSEENRGRFFQVNVQGTENIIDLAAKLSSERVILISSIAVYGRNNSKKSGELQVDEETVCEPQGFYAESKLQAERKASAECTKSGIDLTILRLATVIGEGDEANFLRLIKAIDKKRFVQIGKGKNRKSVVYKDDVGRACCAIIEKSRKAQEIFNVSADSLRTNEIVEIMSEALGGKIKRIAIPPAPVRFLINSGRFMNRSAMIFQRLSIMIEKWLSDDVHGAEKINAEYGFSPEIHARQAIVRECKWYLEQKNSK